MPVAAIAHRLKTLYARLSDEVGRRLRQSFFLYLAALFTVVAVVDAATANRIGGMRQTTFDMLLRMRVNVPEPAADIVIIDIDEKTLAAMAPEYGRWPWPRQVLAEFAERVAAQRPEAIVFDVLFSDPDIQNPDSDAWFNEVLAGLPNTLLPMLRLAPEHDAQSALRYADVPGAIALAPDADPQATVALVVPPFAGAQVAGRLGTINVEPDVDGVVRSYPVRLVDDGWALPSLPAAVAGDRAADAPDRMLLNWRGKPFTYQYASFSDVYLDLLREQRTRPADEFTGKIVIIGSTAAGLHDIKGTPLDRQFPGVEILATAIDNLRAGDWLRVPVLFDRALLCLRHRARAGHLARRPPGVGRRRTARTVAGHPFPGGHPRGSRAGETRRAPAEGRAAADERRVGTGSPARPVATVREHAGAVLGPRGR